MKIPVLMASVFLMSVSAFGQTAAPESAIDLVASLADQSSESYFAIRAFRDNAIIRNAPKGFLDDLKIEVQYSKYDYKSLEQLQKTMENPALKEEVSAPSNDFKEAVKSFKDDTSKIERVLSERNKLVLSKKFNEAQKLDAPILELIESRDAIINGLLSQLMKDRARRLYAAKWDPNLPMTPNFGPDVTGLGPFNSPLPGEDAGALGVAHKMAPVAPTGTDNPYTAYVAKNPANE